MNLSKLQVSAVVPAYNEERTIAKVLSTLTSSPCINEVICINDGSTDSTRSLIESFKKVKLINLKKNRGKANAVCRGVQAARGQIILLIDADLDKIKDSHIHKLADPLIKGSHEVCIGYNTYYPPETLTRPLSGERAYFKKDLMPHLKTLKKKGYGMELYLNYLFNNKKVRLFPIKNMEHPLKSQKYAIDEAVKLMLTAHKDYVREILTQEDPVNFIIHSYFYPFYLKKRPVITDRIKQIIENVKKNLE